MQENLNRIVRSIKCIGVFGISGIRYLFDLLQAKIRRGNPAGVQENRVHTIKYKGNKIYYRPFTSDLSVIVSILVGFKDRWPMRGEYEFDLNFVPSYIIDAGANIGAASIFFANKYPKAKIIAVEPDASNYSLLRHNTKSLGVICVKSGIWWRKAKLSVVHEGMGGYLGKDGFYCVESDADNGVFTGFDIDTLIEKYKVNSPIFIKMDIEGTEKELFEHLENALWVNKINGLAIEIHEEKSGVKNLAQKITKCMEKFGFQGTLIGDIYLFQKL